MKCQAVFPATLASWAALLIPAAMLLALPALAHTAKPTASQPLGWAYDVSCCSLKDCRELPHGAVEQSPAGYIVKATGRVVPYNDRRVKKSKDEFFHICTVNGEAFGNILCLYAPNSGF